MGIFTHTVYFGACDVLVPCTALHRHEWVNKAVHMHKVANKHTLTSSGTLHLCACATLRK